MTTFKPRQMVEVCKDQPDFNRAVASYPKVGLRGMVVRGNGVHDYNVPDGKVAVRFSARKLGYGGDPFLVLFIWEWALKLVK